MKRLSVLLCLFMLFTLTLPTTVLAVKPDDSRLTLVNNIANKNMIEKGSKADWLSEMEANGFKLVSVENVSPSLKTISPKSNEDQCIDLPTADIFEDVNNPGQYVACAWYFWNNDLWQGDLPSPCPYSGHMGGKDCFGLSFSRPVTILSKSFQTWDNGGTRRINSNIADYQGNYGVTFKKYDDFNNAGILYYWDSGFISVNFTPNQSGTYGAWQTMESRGTHDWYVYLLS